MKLQHTIITTVLLLSLCLQGYSQSISQINLQANNDTLEIVLKIDKCNPSQTFLPNATFYYSNGERIPAKTIVLKSANKSMQCGNTDILQWKTTLDNTKINNRVYATVQVKTELDLNLSQHLVKSLVFPGWGDYKLRNGKLYTAYGVLGYGLIASAFVLQNMATKNYNSYKTSYDITQSNNFYNKAIQQRNLSYVALGTSALIWTIDLGLLTAKAKKVQSNPTPQQSVYYNQLANATFEATSNTILFDNRTDFDIAMENGKTLLSKADNQILTDEQTALNQYTQAALEFQKAVTCNISSEIAKIELNNTQTKITAIQQKQSKYNQLIADADAKMLVAKYDDASLYYNQAVALYPKAEYPKSKIKEINDIKNQQLIQQNYNTMITDADIFFKQKNYESAKEYYIEASRLKPFEIYPKNQVSKIDKIFQQQESSLYIQQASIAFNNKKFEDAISLYQQANDLIFSIDNISKIKLCQDKIKDIERQRIRKQCDSFIQKGNYHFDKKQYNDAIAYYINANSIIYSDAIKSKIDLCQERLDDIEYNRLVKQANIAYANNNYETALSLYQEANDLKPNQSKIIDQIIICKKKLDNITSNKGDLTQIYQNSKPSILFIFDYEFNYFNSDMDMSPIGSGFIISSNGYAITNNHVKNAITNTNGVVLTGDGKMYEIEKWVEFDSELDYAIFKIKLKSNETLKPLKISSGGCIEGEKVCAIGNPAGIAFSIKDGIISSFIDQYTIEHSIPTTGGSSGSPIINMNGEVIGLHKASFSLKGNNNLATDIRKIPYKKYVR